MAYTDIEEQTNLSHVSDLLHYTENKNKDGPTLEMLTQIPCEVADISRAKTNDSMKTRRHQSLNKIVKIMISLWIKLHLRSFRSCLAGCVDPDQDCVAIWILHSQNKKYIKLQNLPK